MKTQLPSAIILCALLLVLSLHAFAAGNQTTHVSSSGTSHRASNASALLANALGTRYTGYTITIQPTAAGEAAPTAALLSDASSRTCSAGTMAVEGETYLAAAPVLRALYPGLAVTEQADTLSAQGDDLHLEALAGEAYFTVNDRCFYVPRFVQAAEGQTYRWIRLQRPWAAPRPRTPPPATCASPRPAPPPPHPSIRKRTCTGSPAPSTLSPATSPWRAASPSGPSSSTGWPTPPSPTRSRTWSLLPASSPRWPTGPSTTTRTSAASWRPSSASTACGKPSPASILMSPPCTPGPTAAGRITAPSAVTISICNRSTSRPRPPLCFPFPEGGKTFLNFFKKGLDFWQKPAIIPIVACPARATQNKTALRNVEQTRRSRVVWSSAHDWKSCRPQKGLEGSNPSFSATF